MAPGAIPSYSHPPHLGRQQRIDDRYPEVPPACIVGALQSRERPAGVAEEPSRDTGFHEVRGRAVFSGDPPSKDAYGDTGPNPSRRTRCGVSSLERGGG